MLSKLLFVGGIVASAAARLRFGYADISDCGTGGTEAVTFSTFNLNPPKPVRGEPVSFQASGTADRGVTGGTGTIAVEINGVPLISFPVATCGETTVELPLHLGNFTVSGLGCPVANGDAVTVSSSFTMPPIAPVGSYDVKLSSVDQNGDPAFCINAAIGM